MRWLVFPLVFALAVITGCSRNSEEKHTREEDEKDMGVFDCCAGKDIETDDDAEEAKAGAETRAGESEDVDDVDAEQDGDTPEEDITLRRAKPEEEKSPK